MNDDSGLAEAQELEMSQWLLKVSHGVLVALTWAIGICAIGAAVSGGWIWFVVPAVVCTVALAVTHWVVRPRLQADVDRRLAMLSPAGKERVAERQRFLNAVERMKEGW